MNQEYGLIRTRKQGLLKQSHEDTTIILHTEVATHGDLKYVHESERKHRSGKNDQDTIGE